MKKFVFIFSFVIFSLCSCKNNTETKLIFSESDTIKNTVKSKENNITWSKELEGERLQTPVNEKNENLSKDIEISTEVLKILENQKKSVYPSFDNFGSLDTSKLNNSAKEKITEVCTILLDSDISSLSSHFESKYLFNCVFFINELQTTWKEKFYKDFSGFTKYILGEPFIGEQIIQLPIRFYCNTTTLDVTLYLSKENNYSIYQIKIDRWGQI